MCVEDRRRMCEEDRQLLDAELLARVCGHSQAGIVLRRCVKPPAAYRVVDLPGAAPHARVCDPGHAHGVALLVLAAQVRQRVLQLHAAAQCEHDRSSLAVDRDHVAGPQHAQVLPRARKKEHMIKVLDTHTQTEERQTGTQRKTATTTTKTHTHNRVRKLRARTSAITMGF